MRIKQKTVFITASSSGIGFFLAKEFLKKNYKVIINGRNKKKLSISSKKLDNCNYILGDMSDANVIKKATKKIYNKFKSIDVLIANVGNSNYKKNNKNINFSLNNNLLPTVNLVENSKSILKKKSNIICISSICGSEIIKGAPLGYSVAKAALNFYVKAVSKDLAKAGIAINAILPGNIMFYGSTWQKKINKNYYKTKKFINENVPTKIFGSTKDIFMICEMLSNNDSGFMTGSLIKIDGGQTQSI